MSLDWYNKSRVQVKFDKDIDLFREKKWVKIDNGKECKSN